MANNREGSEQQTQTHRFLLIGWMAGVIVVLLTAILIAASIEEDGTRKALLDKILDWPVLAFAILMMLFGALGREVLELVRTRNIKVGNFLEVGERIREMKEEVGAVEAETDDITGDLQARIEALEQVIYRDTSKAAIFPGLLSLNSSATAPSEHSDDEDASPQASQLRWDILMFDRLVEAIRNSRFQWRTLERLAVENGLAEHDVLRLFRDYGQGIVRMSMGKSGRRIATLIKRD